MVTEEEKKLVIERLVGMPSDMKLSVGGRESISKEELINSIKNGDSLGDKFVEVQLHYLRTIAKQYM